MDWRGDKLTAARARELLNYDRESGIFTWRTTWRNRVAGRRAGTKDSTGYNQLCIDGRSYRSARVAWLWVTGEWPQDTIDHANRDRADDRWSNLRPATTAQNNANQRARRDNSTGYRGVCYLKKEGRYRAMLQRRRGEKGLFIGMFDTAEEASAAYRSKVRERYGEYAPL